MGPSTTMVWRPPARPPSSGATECREATGVWRERRDQLWAHQYSAMTRVTPRPSEALSDMWHVDPSLGLWGGREVRSGVI